MIAATTTFGFQIINEHHKKEFTGLTGRSGDVADVLNGHRRR
jgi:hypothetical protein